MKGLKKIALASAVAAISAGAQAELKALDDEPMGELTGQAGLTIDVETKYTIGEFAYHDADDNETGGMVILQGLSLGGNTNEGTSSFLDNFRMTIDVAAAGESLQYGMSEVAGLTAVHYLAGNTDPDMELAANSVITGGAVQSTDAGAGGLLIDEEKTYGDGDLVIHFGFTDAWQKGGGFAAYALSSGDDGAGNFTADLGSLSYSAARDIASRAVDFNFSIDVIGIATGAYTVGSAGFSTYATTLADGTVTNHATDHVSGGDADGTTTTALISGLSINGYLGPEDLHIENKGNGFGADGSGNLLATVQGRASGNADSKINWDSYFKITDLDVYIDIAGVQLEIAVHNTRGDLSGLDGTSSFGFAHSKRDIYAVKDNVLKVDSGAGDLNSQNIDYYVDGIAINTEFKGDVDITELSFGDTNQTIGRIYLTDIESTTNWTISAH